MTVPPPPPATRQPLVERLHGVLVADPYRWLEDADAADVTDWAEAQNHRTRQALDLVPERGRWHARLVELLGAGASTGCRVAGGKVFALERAAGAERFRLVVRDTGRPGLPAREVVEPRRLAGDDTAAVDWYAPSPDGHLVAVGVSTGGSEHSTLYVVDTDTGTAHADVIPDTRWASVAWDPDSAGFAYTRYRPGSEYEQTVWYHRLGDDPSADVEVWADRPADNAMVGVTGSDDGRWWVVSAWVGWTRADVHVCDRSSGNWRTVIAGVEAMTALHPEGDVLIGTTTLGADRGRVVQVPLAGDLGPDTWVTLVAEGAETIDGARLVAGRLVVTSSRSGVAVVRVDRHEVPMPAAATLMGFDADARTGEVFVQMTGFVQPSTLYKLDGRTLTRWDDLPHPLPADSFVVQQHRYLSSDGVEVPLFVVHRHDVVPGPDVPCVLEGYGGFAIASGPLFRATFAAWVDAGGVYAVAGIRGGAEEGEAWHRAGMREHKQQVFDDFCAAADWLVSTGRASRERLAIEGGSNGGLLVGAAITQRPDLCRAVVCAVPLLDMVRFHLFRIGRLWTPEYGDPEVAEEFAWLYAYSPYHRVLDGTCYPATLLLAGAEDARVDAMHARKMAAALQHASSCQAERPVLLRVEARAGHGQGKPLGKQADEGADVLAFLSWQLGDAITPTPRQGPTGEGR